MPTEITYAPQSSGEMAGTAMEFVITVRYVIEITIDISSKKERFGNRDSIPLFRDLVEKTYAIFFGEAFYGILQDLFNEMDEEDLLEAGLIAEEMTYYNTRYRPDAGGISFEPKDGVEDAKTIKGSFEKLIKKAPRKIRKGLSILNEILGLAKSFL